MKKNNYISPNVEKIELNIEENVAGTFGTDTSEKGWGGWVEL